VPKRTVRNLGELSNLGCGTQIADAHFFATLRTPSDVRICDIDVSVLICVATPFEADLLRQEFQTVEQVRIVETGVGSVNAAHGVTAAVLQRRPDFIVSCGIGGAYPASGLQIGDVVCAEVEIYGDLGAQSPSGFLDMKALGFPVVRGAEPLFNEIPMRVYPLDRRARFVTVSTCTGTDSEARAIENRTQGAVENMEGAAIAHIAHLYGVPVGEVRGISNMATNRDKGSWRMKEASEAAQRAVIAWVRTLNLKT
jgi:futalosine hydrolase